jgi:Skp family chaperone for outer membrane proteins
MPSRQNLATIATLAVAVTLCSVVSLRGAGAAAKAATIAVVDVQKVFGALDEKQGVEADITAQTEKLQKEDQDRQTELKALEADLKILNADSDAFKQTRDKLENKAIEYQTWKQFKGRQLENEKALRIERLYNKVIDDVEKLAKKNGYDLVLYKDQTEKLGGQNQQQLAAMIQVRKVLYVTPDIDVTDQITQSLNNDWNNRKGAPAPKK